MTQTISKKDRPQCDCGTKPTDESARKVVKYSFWGMFAMGLVGISATPIDVYFVCRKCKQPFGRLSKSERRGNS
ncbi:MAG: hypothetical protein O9301_02070 [Leptospira sp.]|nr:hypothetical protein [Leptospira sp.]